MSDLQALKAVSRAREDNEKRQTERRRAALVLILRHLADNGYRDAYERLCSESNLSLSKVRSGGRGGWCPACRTGQDRSRASNDARQEPACGCLPCGGSHTTTCIAPPSTAAMCLPLSVTLAPQPHPWP